LIPKTNDYSTHGGFRRAVFTESAENCAVTSDDYERALIKAIMVQRKEMFPLISLMNVDVKSRQVWKSALETKFPGIKVRL
jgi:ABC-type sulfate transport system substrate-binding protein